MFANISPSKPARARAAFSVGWVVVALALGSLEARSGSLGGIGGALGNAVGGALGSTRDTLGKAGGALKGSLGETTDETTDRRALSSPADDSNGPGNAGSAGRAARSGNWVGAPYVLEVTRRSEGHDSCDDTFIDLIRGGGCKFASPDVTGEALDQASYSGDNEPVVLDPAPQIQVPAGKKATSLQSTARLSVEKPPVEEPELTVVPKPVPPKVVDKAQPQSSPLLTCNKAEAIVGGYGFSGIKPADCDGQVFSFNASRDGKPFLITLNAMSGELIQVRKRPPTTAPEG